ncbi:MAG: VOC family protein [Chloroflexi bacterium]|nr:VOC family protein [Chloroflexota bacterium]
MTTATELKSVGQILVPVSDVDASVAFYQDVLGLPVLMRFPGIAFMDAAGIRLYLARVPQKDFQGRATVYFWVDDVTGTQARLVERGAVAREAPSITWEAPDYDFWLGFVADPDGNNIGLMRNAPKGTERG